MYYAVNGKNQKLRIILFVINFTFLKNQNIFLINTENKILQKNIYKNIWFHNLITCT